MKAISIKEPWASLIRAKRKPYETRTWATKYRGKLLLCCSKKPFSRISGLAFAIVDLVDIREMTKEDEALAMCDIYPNAKVWVFENITIIPTFHVKGKLRLFEVDYDGFIEFKTAKNKIMISKNSIISIEDTRIEFRGVM